MTGQMEVSARRNWFDGCCGKFDSQSTTKAPPPRGKMVMCSRSLSTWAAARALSGKTHLWKEMARNGCIVNGAQAAAFWVSVCTHTLTHASHTYSHYAAPLGAEWNPMTLAATHALSICATTMGCFMMCARANRIFSSRLWSSSISSSSKWDLRHLHVFISLSGSLQRRLWTLEFPPLAKSRFLLWCSGTLWKCGVFVNFETIHFWEPCISRR